MADRRWYDDPHRVCRAERDELVSALREAWDLFGEVDTISPEHLRDDDYFDRWCIRVKAILGV